ncbi:unnamed protein product, partial [marine sediment metagenome]
RYFRGRPEISNLATLDNGQGVIALGSRVSAASIVNDEPLRAAANGMLDCPQAGKWAIAVWAGDDGTDTEQAFATCGEEAVTVAYSIDPDTQLWFRWFAGRPEISNLTALNNMQGIIALGVGTPTPAGQVNGITDTEIILGAHTPLSGAFGAVYARIPQTVEAYFNYINDTQGGVCGRKIVYKVEDNQGDPAKGMEAVRKLVEQDKVFAIVGSLGDSPHAAVWEYLNENEVPDILVSAGAHMFGADPQGHPWTVQMMP